jgi:uncharacterized damage-inducible protein DinB
MNDELSALVKQVDSIAKSVEKVFGGLSAEQLNWKPNEKSWSIAQCLEHLIVTNKLEFPAVENALKENYKNPFWSKIPFLSDVFGKTAIYLFKPQNQRKFKAPKSFQPSKSRFSETIVQDFVAHQQELVEIFERSRDLDLRKTKIISPISEFITYSLMDAFQLLTVHEQRHFGQAERVLQMQNS